MYAVFLKRNKYKHTCITQGSSQNYYIYYTLKQPTKNGHRRNQNNKVGEGKKDQTERGRKRRERGREGASEREGEGGREGGRERGREGGRERGEQVK